MGEVDRARLKVALARHYAVRREDVATETIGSLAQAMLTEDARVHKAQPQGKGLAAFVAAQVRYIPAWTWVAQAVLVALMCALAYAVGNTGAAKLAVGMLAATSVLVGVPTVHASKRFRVAELEYACPHNAVSVVVARLVVLGCSTALAVALMIAATAASLDVSVFTVALWACPPFFASCAGALALLRKAAPSSAVAMSVIWVAACSAGLLVVATIFPQAYANASLGVWAAAAACALVWLVREVAMTFRAATAGLEAFSPYMAKTYH